jgi:hypothetical protein
MREERSDDKDRGVDDEKTGEEHLAGQGEDIGSNDEAAYDRGALRGCVCRAQA